MRSQPTLIFYLINYYKNTNNTKTKDIYKHTFFVMEWILKTLESALNKNRNQTHLNSSSIKQTQIKKLGLELKELKIKL